jgi:hypothetical protein
LNKALREVFTAFNLQTTESGLRLIPVIPTEALARMIGTPRKRSPPLGRDVTRPSYRRGHVKLPEVAEDDQLAV